MTQELLNEEILARIFELEKVNRSNSNIEDVLNARIDGIEKHLEDKITIVEDHLKDLCQTKIDGMEKATTLASNLRFLHGPNMNFS
jgi:exosome complex RNA-binding protein Rrp4